MVDLTDELQVWARSLRRETAPSLDDIAGRFEDLDPRITSVVLMLDAAGRYSFGVIGTCYGPEMLMNEGMIGIYAATEKEIGGVRTYAGKPFKEKK